MTATVAIAKSANVLHLRRLVISHPCWAALLLGMVLLLKALVPSGYMTVASGKAITVELCSSSGAGSMMLHIPMEERKHDGGALASGDQTCAFAGLGAQALAAVDPLVLGAAIAFTFILALLVADLRLPRHRTYLQPPLRGPPDQI